MKPLAPLPICPAPLAGEALRSWLTRVGRVYRLTPEGLATRTQLLATRDDALEDVNLVRVAELARLPLAHVRALQSGPTAWLLHEEGSTVVCFSCLARDLREGEPLHGRAIWRQGWRIYCPDHRVRLESIATRLVRPPRTGSARRESLARLRARVETQAATVPRPTAAATHVAIRSMEAAITSALANERVGGPLRSSLSAREFLRVVADVTTWALSNFEREAGHPAAAHPPSCRHDDRAGVFRAADRRLPGIASPAHQRTLRDTLSPGRRAGALWWAYALMANAEPATLLRVDSTERQVALLAGRTPAGLDWLRQRMASWPDLYLQANWIDPASLPAV